MPANTYPSFPPNMPPAGYPGMNPNYPNMSAGYPNVPAYPGSSDCNSGYPSYPSSDPFGGFPQDDFCSAHTSFSGDLFYPNGQKKYDSFHKHFFFENGTKAYDGTFFEKYFEHKFFSNIDKIYLKFCKDFTDTPSMRVASKRTMVSTRTCTIRTPQRPMMASLSERTTRTGSKWARAVPLANQACKCF
jgi:hypothetical protein